MTWTQEHPTFRQHLPEARANGVSYHSYYNRVRYLEWDAKRAATTPADGPLKPDPRSINSLCKAAGIDRRRFHTVRDELEDAGVPYTDQDVIDIALARSRA